MRHNLACNLGLLSIFFWLGNDESAAGSSNPNYIDYYHGNASAKMLRFHDFEPRPRTNAENSGGGGGQGRGRRGGAGGGGGGSREGRGFHFSESGEDVSVEMEFIVPFFRIPVKRSMKLARDAVHGLLNLHTGALLNTAVVVGAGAIIAAIVRLVLAPMVFTSIGNGFGYNAKQFDDTPKSSRGMRSLTQVLESQLDEHSIDVSVCAQRAICHYLQRNAAQLQNNQSTPSPARLIDVLANSRWLDSLLNGTAVFSAIDVARSSRSNCKHIYRSCSCVAIWAASEKEAETSSSSTTASKWKEQKNVQRLRLISFDTVDKDIALGLNYLMPFVEVPVKRKRNAPPRPLVIVNSAAIFSCGLLAASGLIVGHLIRSMSLENIVPDSKSEQSSNHKARSLLDEEQNFLQLFDNFKLVYRNTSGDRVETGLPSLIVTMERTFLENDINLPVCLLKSICALTHKAGEKVRGGIASDVELMLDGVISWSWLMSWLEQSALRDAIEAGRVAAPEYCNIKYPRCKWTAPEEQLLHLMHNNVQFK
ncbi:GH18394 [Drosophila grimshawi]|uniref:GH18394 n=1 Tax=Drosophila grimshawi TaxID=7222 RepID=B4JES8_DROGR|nr:GH18394 [Drosophila grimshawi]